MNVALTGASGHIGHNLALALAERGSTVRVLVHRNTPRILHDHVSEQAGDVLVRESLRPFLDGIDVVFHLAAVISIDGDRKGIVRAVNVDGTRNMLEAARAAGVRRFIHFSSIHAFQAEPLNEPLDEMRPLVGESGFAYDRSKADSDRLVLEAVAEDLDAVILHPTSVLGPCDHEPSLLGATLIRMATGRMPVLVPGGYNWVDVRDVVSAAVAAVKHGQTGGRYLLGGHWVSLQDLAAQVAIAAGSRPPRWTVPMGIARLGVPFARAYGKFANTTPVFTRESLHTVESSHRDIRSDRARRHLGHEPRSFETTIEDTVTWFRDAGFFDRHHRFPTPKRPARCSTCSSISGLAFPS